MKKLLRSYLFLFIVAGGIVALDQVSKAWVRDSLAVGDMWMPLASLSPYFRIVHWYNTGVAFGMLQGMNLLFASLSTLVAVAIIYYYPRVSANDLILRIAMSMQLGGAVGNLIDRVTVGHVTDFISVGSFPVFNVADASISVGVCVLILGVWLQERREKALAQLEQLEQPEHNLDHEEIG